MKKKFSTSFITSRFFSSYIIRKSEGKSYVFSLYVFAFRSFFVLSVSGKTGRGGEGRERGLKSQGVRYRQEITNKTKNPKSRGRAYPFRLFTAYLLRANVVPVFEHQEPSFLYYVVSRPPRSFSRDGPGHKIPLQ